MRSPSTWFDRTYQFIASKQLAMYLFVLTGVSLVPGTFAAENFHLSPLSRVLVAVLGLNLALCTLQRIRMLRRPVLLIHAGILVIIAGTVISAFGSIATVNVYEGTATDIAYRWDLGRDIDLGYELAVRKITIDYYPLPVRVGVLKGEEKLALQELRTGESFALDGYTVRADAFEPFDQNLRLTIFRGAEFVGQADTEGTVPLPDGFPYSFKLVSYRDPVLRRAWVDLRITGAGGVLAEGTSEVNHPLTWNGIRFHFTNVDQDEYGVPYAGIQIVRAPETPVVYAGFILLSAGTVYWMTGKLRAKGPLA